MIAALIVTTAIGQKPLPNHDATPNIHRLRLLVQRSDDTIAKYQKALDSLELVTRRQEDLLKELKKDQREQARFLKQRAEIIRRVRDSYKRAVQRSDERKRDLDWATRYLKALAA